jgi:hypothetical protein
MMSSTSPSTRPARAAAVRPSDQKRMTAAGLPQLTAERRLLRQAVLGPADRPDWTGVQRP